MQLRLNGLLTQLLGAASCWGSRLHLQPADGAGPISLLGHHRSGKNIAVWPIERPLKGALGHYLAELPTDIGLRTIDVDLRQPAFAYYHTSATAQAQAAAQAEAAAAQAQVTQQQERRAYLRQHLAAALYGPELAAQVAAALRRERVLAYRYRDYSGMGLDYHAATFRYGEGWEGDLQPERLFTDYHELVAWLAQQSDLSLAHLESQDPTAWHNQTVTRLRLLELVHPAA